jgi:hypothetical protein
MLQALNEMKESTDMRPPAWEFIAVPTQRTSFRFRDYYDLEEGMED